MKFFTLIFLFSMQGLAINPNATPRAQVFKTINPADDRQCSATLMKVPAFLGDKCVLLTNAHCVTTTGSRIKLFEISHSLPSVELQRLGKGQRQEFSVLVKKMNTAFDLAELQIPDEIEQFYCGTNGIQRIFPPGPSLMRQPGEPLGLGLVSLGFVGEKSHASFSGYSNVGIAGGGQIVGWPYAGSSVQSVYQTQIPEMPYVVKVNDFKVLHGMSGGPVINQYKGINGINIWVRDQFIDQSFYIPMHSVMDFINTTFSKNEKQNLQAIGQRVTPVGKNGHGDGGKNGHGDGGKNGHGDGGNNGIEASLYVKKLSEFLLPDEGVVNPENKNEIILGLGEWSVDGEDDLRRVQKRVSSPSWIKKANTPDSYAAEEVRNNILSRLSGGFTSRTEIQGASMARTRLYAFQKEVGAFKQFEDLFAVPTVFIDIGKVIRIQTSKAFINDRNTIAPTDKVLPPLDFIFIVAYEEGSKKIVLLGDKPIDGVLPKLICDNRNYLKLNCVGDSMALSLHMFKDGELELNFVIKAGIDYPSLFHFHAETFKFN